MYDKQVVRRRRAVLALLVGLSIIMLTGYFGESTGGPLHRFQAGLQTILSPIEDGASRAFKPVRDLAGWFGDVFNAKGENKTLKSDLASARTELAKAQTLVRDDAQLRKLVGLDETLNIPASQRLTGRVISKSPTAWYSTVQIDIGKGDGVKVDQPVVNGYGLVGKVEQVTGGTAVVQLMTDSKSSVSAMIAPDGAQGQVQPSVGDPSQMQLQFLQKGYTIKQGEKVVTSGSTSSRLESIYPRGIPIGEVTNVQSNDLELYRQVRVRPYVDFRRIDYVQVITTKLKQPTPVNGTAAP
ncbi:MAG: rod shape-determining protein MreC [Thermoleophilaceae bacterium]|nr:rod shape-determining protein MreC [Thermoleophilaceae bacterium]